MANSPNDKQIGRQMHQVYHTVYKANTRVKEIWFRFADEIAYSITMKQLVDLSACIFIEIERKTKEKREKNGFDLGSPGSYYGNNTN